LFALALWLCSAGVVQKYVGTFAAIGYAPLCVAGAAAVKPVVERSSP
jgi:hypothetical protein